MSDQMVDTLASQRINQARTQLDPPGLDQAQIKINKSVGPLIQVEG